ncbi:8-amino-7-oxononanoate synthase [Fontisphaera persica]|uniref:8-amino-7-oxononanoate synthase n=1 Tax=Fontisphaera persica TaxID=2974023 RepID=UPI0024BF7E57|nr:8-amino-7-oxononanoate synthase [Fontisphaera persica]WCJ58592.1 8-amino-7-oxononanoate synthase [Fontisphaera persica]
MPLIRRIGNGISTPAGSPLARSASPSTVPTASPVREGQPFFHCQHGRFSFECAAGNVTDFAAQLTEDLARWRERGLGRALTALDSPQGPRVRLSGRDYLNFSANDYLGLANHPRLKEAAAAAVQRYGAGAGAARLLSGSLPPQSDLETALADYKNAGAALSFSSGYATALGVIPALVDKGDVVLLDKLAHACLVDGARLSGARLRVFAHNDLEDLEAKLQWAVSQRAAGGARRVLIVCESVYSMDGDAAPLADLVALKERYGAWLLVDEAHATGVLGPRGAGLAQQLNLAGRIEVQMGTLGKALGAAGGFIAGPPVLRDWLVNRARSFVFSTAPPPAVAAAALAGVQLAQSAEGEQRRQALRERVAQLVAGLRDLGWQVADPAAAIVPLLLGAEERALAWAARLREQGFFLPAIRYPTVPHGRARLRISLSAAHTAEDVHALLEALRKLT